MDQQTIRNCTAIVRQKKAETARCMAVEINRAMDEFTDKTGLEIVSIKVELQRLQTIGRPKIIVAGVEIGLDL